jgi:hypothetical protein
VAQEKPEPVFPVGFDEETLSEDLDRLSEGAEEALDAFRKELQRVAGRPLRSGLRCRETPETSAGPARVRLRRPASSPGLAPDSHAETVYEVADRRLSKKDS